MQAISQKIQMRYFHNCNDLFLQIQYIITLLKTTIRTPTNVIRLEKVRRVSFVSIFQLFISKGEYILIKRMAKAAVKTTNDTMFFFSIRYPGMGLFKSKSLNVYVQKQFFFSSFRNMGFFQFVPIMTILSHISTNNPYNNKVYHF